MNTRITFPCHTNSLLLTAGPDVQSAAAAHAPRRPPLPLREQANRQKVLQQECHMRMLLNELPDSQDHKQTCIYSNKTHDMMQPST